MINLRSGIPTSDPIIHASGHVYWSVWWNGAVGLPCARNGINADIVFPPVHGNGISRQIDSEGDICSIIGDYDRSDIAVRKPYGGRKHISGSIRVNGAKGRTAEQQSG